MNERNMIQDIIRPNFLHLESKTGRSSRGHCQPVTSVAAQLIRLPSTSETSRVTFSSAATCDHNCQSGCKPAISYSSSVSSLTWDNHADQVPCHLLEYPLHQITEFWSEQVASGALGR